MRKISRFPIHQGGFSLIEMLLALGLVIMVAGLALVGVRRDNETSQARAVGDQMSTVGAALNTYIATRYATLVTHTPGTDDMPCTSTADCGTAADPGPRICVAQVINSQPGRVCTITSETLRRNSLVPNSFSGRNPFGSEYLYEIQITGSDPNWIVNGMVATEEPYTTGGTVRYDLLGEAMLAAGADSGMTQELATRVDGYNGAWAENGYAIIDELGLLAYRGGYSSNAYAAYLRRDGSTPMTGNLDMDGHDINNVVNIDAAGDISAAGTVEAANLRATADQPNALIFGDGVAADRATVGTSTVAGSPILALRHNNRVRVEDMSGVLGDFEAGDATVQTLSANNSISSSGTLAVAGDSRLSGRLHVGTNTHTTPVGGITANGRMRTLDSMVTPIIYAGGDTSNTSLTPCTSAAPCARLQAGGLYLNHVDGGVAGNLRGFELNAATGTISTANLGGLNVTGDFHAFGEARVGNLDVDTTLEIANNAIVFDPTIVPGGVTPYAVCSAQRTATHTSTGELAQCINGLWTPMGGAGDSLRVLSPTTVCTQTSTSSGASVATCPSTYPVLTGGGHQFMSGAPRAAPISSYQSGATWVIYAGATNAYSDTGAYATQNSCFRAIATCARR